MKVVNRPLQIDVEYAQGPGGDDPSEKSGQNAPVDIMDLIAYIADLTAELVVLARRANLDVSAYLLDMSRIETLSALDGYAASKKRESSFQAKSSERNASRPPGSRSNRPASSNSKAIS
jgi:hypothetical protein